MKGDKTRRFQGAPKADPYWPWSDMSQAWINGNTAEKGEIISWIFQIIGVSFPHTCGTVAADHYEKSRMQVKREWMRAEEAARPVERRGSTAVERPRRGALSHGQNLRFGAVTAVKTRRGGKRADWYRLMWNLTSGETSSLRFGFEFRWGRKCLHGWRMQRTM